MKEKLSQFECHERFYVWDPIGDVVPDCCFDVYKIEYNISDSHEFESEFNVNIETKPDINK
jgi:hypothetical protein